MLCPERMVLCGKAPDVREEQGGEMLVRRLVSIALATRGVAPMRKAPRAVIAPE